MRSCDGCTLCCTHLSHCMSGAGEFCPHDNGDGCDIYGDHPAECKSFRCAWLDEKIDVRWKPDKIGCMFEAKETVTPEKTLTVLFAYGTIPLDFLEQIPAGAVVVDRDGTVYGSDEDMRTYRLPSELIEQARRNRKQRLVTIGGIPPCA